MNKYDVVIIGAGLGGLECGVMLSKEGYNVCVLEKNDMIGGCLQSFSRKGHLLDTGIHYVGSLDDGQILNQYFKYFGVMDSLQLARLDEDAFDTILLDGRQYDMGMGYDRFEGNLAKNFPHQKENIKAFSRLIQATGNLISVEKLRKGILASDSMTYLQVSAHQTINDIFSDETIKKVLVGRSSLYAGIKEKTSLYHYGMINHSFVESAYRFINGSQQLADALTAQIEAAGGCVRTRSEVTAIQVNDRLVESVEVNGEEIIHANHFISNLHPSLTYRLVGKTPRIKKAFQTRLSLLENSFPLFTLHVVLKKDQVPYLNGNYYIHGDGYSDTWNVIYDETQDTPRTVLLCMQASSSTQQYADVISIMCPISAASFSKWNETKVNRRGTDYEEYKNHLAEKIIDLVGQHFPAIKENIEHLYTSSPLTYRDYTGTPDGSAYGIIKDYHSPLTTLISVNTKFSNMFHTGQNMNIHGALGVTVTSVFTCSKLLGIEYLAKKIGNV